MEKKEKQLSIAEMTSINAYMTGGYMRTNVEKQNLGIKRILELSIALRSGNKTMQ